MSDIEQALVPVFSFLESFRSEVREGFQGVAVRLDSLEQRVASPDRSRN